MVIAIGVWAFCLAISVLHPRHRAARPYGQGRDEQREAEAAAMAMEYLGLLSEGGGYAMRMKSTINQRRSLWWQVSATGDFSQPLSVWTSPTSSIASDCRPSFLSPSNTQVSTTAIMRTRTSLSSSR